MKKLFLGLVMVTFSIHLQAQEVDSALVMKVEDVSRFDLVFQRSFLLGAADATFPMQSTSGSYFVGLGFKFGFLNNKLGIRAQPGINWLRLNYSTNDDLFPESSILPQDSSQQNATFEIQRHRLTYFEVPLGIYFNISQDEDLNPKAFIEAGGFISYLFAEMLKEGTRANESAPLIRTKTPEIAYIGSDQRLRYGLYARAGYRWFALFASLRLSDVFEPGAVIRNSADEAVVGTDGELLSVPQKTEDMVPQLQIGVTIFL
ncbi:MAG: outer membrane beta-barrel protein [Bacteroidota bacterium]